MSIPEQISGRTAREYLARFPNTPTRTLAKKAYKENPAIWKTFDACHQIFRNKRGTKGKLTRSTVSDKSQFRKGSENAVVPVLPEPIEELADWQAFAIDVPGTYLIISDIHIPFHSLPAVKSAISEGQARGKKLKGVIINGDFADMHAVSFFEKDPREKDFPGEIAKIIEFEAYLKATFPKADLYWKEGNHCERYWRYLMAKAPELLGVEEFQFEKVVKLEKFGISYVKDKRPIKLGKLWILHGHEFKRGFAAPVNAARGLYLRAHISALQGDCHATSQHSEKNLDEHVVSCWSTGCLCSLHPRYMPINKWNHGFAIVEVSNDGAFDVTNYRIIGGKAYS